MSSKRFLKLLGIFSATKLKVHRKVAVIQDLIYGSQEAMQ